MRQIITLFLLVCSLASNAQNSLSFHSLNEVFSYADNHSYTFKNATQQVILAKYETLAAQLSKWNVKGDANFSSTDNTKLPTSFLPAEIFGGPAGTFKQITLGQQYISNFNIAPQVDVLSPYAAAKVRIGHANEKLTDITNQLNKKNLYDTVAGSYYAILSLQWQIIVTQKSLASADTLAQILRNKQKEGIARSQDVNNAIATELSTQDKLQQQEVQLLQQYNILKMLCDIDANMLISIQQPITPTTSFDASLVATGHLVQQEYEWQKHLQDATLYADKKWYYPTLSLFGSVAWQQNTNNHFYDATPWLNSSYIGLKLTLPIIPDANKVAAVKYDRINVITANNTLKHAALQDSVNNQQIQLDYKRAFNSYQIATQIESLKQDSYQKNLNIYKEGILSATDLINSFIDWQNNSLNTVTQLAKSELAKSKININNTIQ